MDKKKDPNRYTLRFNGNVPDHQIAIDVLNNLGRHKSDYVAKAIIHYRDCSVQSVSQNLNEQIKAYISEALKDIVCSPGSINSLEHRQTGAKASLELSEINCDLDVCQDQHSENLCDKDVNDIIAAVSSFRKF